LKRDGLVPDYHLEFEAGSPRLAELARQAASLGVDALLVVAGPVDSGRLVKALRDAGFAGPIGGGPALARSAALSAAGPSAEGVFFPLILDPTASLPFKASFEKRYGVPSDWAAVEGYDAANLLFAAIRFAGLNRARIRDALQELSPWSGAGGLIHWDSLGQNHRPVQLGVIRRGQAVPASP